MVDREGRLISFVPPFGEEMVNLPKLEVFLKEKRGVYENYTFLTKKVGEKYTVIVVLRLKYIKRVQDELMKFVVLTASIMSIFILIFTSISQRISKEGPLEVEVAGAKTEDELGQLQKAYKDRAD